MIGKIFVAGHRGLVGSAIVRALKSRGIESLEVCERSQLDLRDRSAVDLYLGKEKPDYVFLAAARVGGIGANARYPAEFIYENLAIQTNVIDASYKSGVKKLLFLGSSCIYPKHADQPISEDALLRGPLEPTNEWYAIAKIAGLKMCQAYNRQYGFNAISVMPTNLYGPGDSFDLENSHVIPALIRKFHEAKDHGDSSVEIWGTGSPRREFLHVDDLADACIYLMDRYDGVDPINVGWGKDISIKELAELIACIVDFRGAVHFDTSKPDGTPRKVLDISRIRELGWTPKIALADGLSRTLEWFRKDFVQTR